MRSYIWTNKRIKGFLQHTLFPFTRTKKSFMTHLFLFNVLTKEFFKNRIVLLFNQKIRFIKPQISNNQVHKCTSNYGGEVPHSNYYKYVL